MGIEEDILKTAKIKVDDGKVTISIGEKGSTVFTIEPTFYSIRVHGEFVDSRGKVLSDGIYFQPEDHKTGYVHVS